MSWFVFEEAPEVLTGKGTWGHFVGELIPTETHGSHLENLN